MSFCLYYCYKILPCKIFYSCSCRSGMAHHWKSTKHITHYINNSSISLPFEASIKYWKVNVGMLAEGMFEIQKHTKLLYLWKRCLLPSFDKRNVPVKFVSITAFHPFRVMSLAQEGNCPPPLFIKKSILSCSLSIDVTVFLK